MASETDLLNDALSMIGASPIAAIDDGSVAANHCQRLYPALRDGLIRAHHWNWAMARVQLAQDATAPPFEFAYQYALPADLLKIVEYNGATPNSSTSIYADYTQKPVSRYVIEGRKLLTNDGEVKIVYLRRITNPDEWDALFYQVVAAWLASKLASAITKDERKAKAKLEEAMGLLLPMAMAVDGQEGTVYPNVSDALTWGRR